MAESAAARDTSANTTRMYALRTLAILGLNEQVIGIFLSLKVCRTL